MYKFCHFPKKYCLLQTEQRIITRLLANHSELRGSQIFLTLHKNKFQRQDLSMHLFMLRALYNSFTTYHGTIEHVILVGFDWFDSSLQCDSCQQPRILEIVLVKKYMITIDRSIVYKQKQHTNTLVYCVVTMDSFNISCPYLKLF